MSYQKRGGGIEEKKKKKETWIKMNKREENFE